MPRLAWTGWLIAPLLLAGCAENSLVLKGQVEKFQQQQAALARQNQELQTRATALDRDNQELETLVAQSRQKNQVIQDQLALIRKQLGLVTTQLSQARDTKTNNEQKIQTLMASMQRQGGVSIQPNNSLAQTPPTVDLPGLEVRRDADVIRIELPSASLFEVGSATLRPEGSRLLVGVAAKVSSTYPDQKVGVEGHTDSSPVRHGTWRNSHHLSTAQALVVHELLLSHTRLRPNQLFVVGHGGNHPVVSNATVEGKHRNRRVELVIYPEPAH